MNLTIFSLGMMFGFLLVLLNIIIGIILVKEEMMRKQFNKLKELERTDIKDIKDFKHIYEQIKKQFCFDYDFEIVYLMDGYIVLSINNDYFKVDSKSLIFLFNQDDITTNTIFKMI